MLLLVPAAATSTAVTITAHFVAVAAGAFRAFSLSRVVNFVIMCASLSYFRPSAALFPPFLLFRSYAPDAPLKI